MHPTVLIFFSCFHLLLLLPRPCWSSDLQSLLEFKKGIRSDASGLVLSSWLQSPAAANSFGCPRGFHGVSCDASGVSVVSISLSGLGLAGELKFGTLASLKSLRSLLLSNNSFSGRLVPGIASLASLEVLDLAGNRFYGPVPGRITEISTLNHLNLSYNQFTGGIPEGFGKLQQLRTLDLRSNGLWGDAGVLLSELRNVEHLDLSRNEFSGSIDLGPGNFSSLGDTLRYMNLSGNSISGGLLSSDSVRLFKNLEVLDVGQNRIGGQLPELDSLTNLRVLSAADNMLYGPLPVAVFGDAMPLVELDLSSNRFTGSAISVNSTTMKILNLSSNALSGSLPSSLGSCTTVDLSKNRLSGELFAMANWKEALEVIDLSSNMLSGSFPENIPQFGSLISISIGNNSLSGPLPSVLGTYPRLTTVDFSSNELTGPISSSLLTSSTLTSLNLSRNQLTGSIPLQSLHSIASTGGASYSPLEVLDLSDNHLSGSLPPEIGDLKKLRFLALQKNFLSGELPVELSKISGVVVLDLSMNHFKGRIPELPHSSLEMFNVSYNELSGVVPQSLERFPESSFHPGNVFLVFPHSIPAGCNNSGIGSDNSHRRNLKRVASVVGCVGAIVLIIFVFMAFYRLKSQKLCGRNGFGGKSFGRNVKLGGILGCPNMSVAQKEDPVQLSTSFSNAHLLNPASRSLSPQRNLMLETLQHDYPDMKGHSESMKSDAFEHCPPKAEQELSPKSPICSPLNLIDAHIEQPVVLDVYSPDRLAGELFLFDRSLVFTAEDLSRAPAEVLGRSSHGTSYKATLDNGHMLTVKWLRIGLVKHKKDFAKEAKRLWSIRHSNIISLRGYYWGPREQERLIITDYVDGESLALYLHESTPSRYSRLSVSQRLKVAIDIACCLYYLHDEKNLPHGNLKPTNIVLGPDLTARLTDYALHRLMTPSGTAEQILNLGALGYRAPELASPSKPVPTFKADVYAFGVILMELLTRRSAGDIISGQSGAVDLTDWVRMCNREGRGTECFDRDIAGLEEAPRAMEELLAVSLRCILPVNERPNIQTVFQDLCSIRL